MKMPEGDYTIFKSAEGDHGCAMMQQKDLNRPPMWLQYVAVDDVDATLLRAKANGGDVVMEPMDAEGIGRFGVFQGPTGAVLGVITPAPQAG